MKIKKLVFYPVFMLLIAACNNSENKEKKLAEGMCDCFDQVGTKFSKETKELLLKCDTAANPVETFRKELAGYPDSTKLFIDDELKMRFAEGDVRPFYTVCLDSLKQVYVDTAATKEQKNDQLFKAIDEMGKISDCKLAHSYYRLVQAAFTDMNKNK